LSLTALCEAPPRRAVLEVAGIANSLRGNPVD